MRGVWIIAALAVLATTGCFNECGFNLRCDGNVLERCGDGPDHIVGRKVRRFPCQDPNPVCVELDESEAHCAASAERSCQPGSADSCERGVISRCVEGLVVLEDCQREPGTGRCGAGSVEGRMVCL